ncbi:two component, sigma-54 specific, transcriptional regulator, Fis family [Desulfosarcina variabilis str. Montpellier]|uniref:PEP-CTERM-box response regulator transcription factor n=1 Tax=Desulfosarcina variabilis TaxID=2300 RepID=UPI003AFA4B2B
MSKKKLLIIEDESSVAKQLKWSLNDIYAITIAPDASKARGFLSSGEFAVATLDLGLPPSPDSPEQGLKLLQEAPDLTTATKIIVITGNAEQEIALQAVALGAHDFCSKPIDVDMLKVILDRAFAMHDLETDNRRLHEQTMACSGLLGMIGISDVMQKVFQLIQKISGKDYPVLITGASGTGKEVAANIIHKLSPRSSKPLVIINCGAIPENLIESELFGHEKGAFTGATEQKKGKFELADGGTLFLDEIGELPLNMQVKLLRALQEGTIERIGGTRTIHLDVRIIAATNADLNAAVAEKKFREDLFFRLNVVPVELPLLSERPEDIMVLAHHFLTTEARAANQSRVAFSLSAMAALSAHPWPGNVRELQNRIRRALTIFDGQSITVSDLGLNDAEPESSTESLLTLKEARDQAERRCVRQALLHTGNNISRAAKLLAISRPTLHDLINKHGIETG